MCIVDSEHFAEGHEKPIPRYFFVSESDYVWISRPETVMDEICSNSS